jgi:xylan 1,4-beta-xylosidase
MWANHCDWIETYSSTYGKDQFLSLPFLKRRKRMKQSRILRSLLACVLFTSALWGQPQPQLITVDAAAPSAPFPHFWEQMFGSGRAILSLRYTYQSDLRAVKDVTNFQYVRFHGILLDEVGVYDEDKQGNPRYNFTYVDQIYDGLLRNGIRPFVEISFMPKALASQLDYQGFWYKPIVSPPKDYVRWDDLITQFTRHLVDRYGIDEVSQWYFEVWNEPNIGFWTGKPAQETYFQLYDHTAKDIKTVSLRLRVGGPSTAQAAWIREFIAHTVAEKIAVDFISSHIYGMDQASKVFGSGVTIPEEEMVYRGTKKMYEDIRASARPELPLIVSEFSGGRVPTGNRDTLYMGPWIANAVRECDGLTNMMSFWPFSDVFEEHGVARSPFPVRPLQEGRGLIAPDGIPKPSYVAFALLHQLGDERISEPGDDVIVTKRKDGVLEIALWNLVDPGDAGASRRIRLEFRHIPPHSQAVVYRLDKTHEDTLDAYRAMGSPIYPTHAQVEELWRIAKILPAQRTFTQENALTLDVPPEGLAIVEVKESR